ncbi:fatty acid desaturase family protein [Thiorhodococcus mannitoliphagus]|uniref:Fatty acid desaturase family protein n=1 Tax=Thiorhodococcus mannitoliphagus TaxID=329406 RepID=A0A6P1E1H3_9GAMM|nr:fatty acid desaturase family protein [Thiorhodococcus mannitoliphagus]NEX23171.1 fatty acid desaturase family protein [Thiorhodococcus mannitoliphagus]
MSIDTAEEHIASENINKNERTSHPHDAVKGVPNRLPSSLIRELSALSPGKALFALFLEWLGIAAAIAAYVLTKNPFVYLFAVIFIGARQQALTVLGHDASHYRFLPNRFWNDWISNFFMQWPMFISTEGFRKYHGAHHRYLNDEKDGNRFLWKTHNQEGHLVEEWTYPKSKGQLAAKIIRRGLFFTGLRWIIRGLIGMFVIRGSLPSMLARILFYGAFASWFTMAGLWWEFLLLWIIPLCTWHIVTQYIRLIAEHSAVQSDVPGYQETRTTIPKVWEALFILPRNIGYHLEHHWYPSVPFYNLPALHKALMDTEEFPRSANISYSILRSLQEVVKK